MKVKIGTNVELWLAPEMGKDDERSIGAVIQLRPFTVADANFGTHRFTTKGVCKDNPRLKIVRVF